jgi:hypothetical protein
MNDFSIRHCARCKCDIKIPPFTTEQKKEIKTVRQKKGMGSTLARIREMTILDLMDSKYLHCMLMKPGFVTGVIMIDCKVKIRFALNASPSI